MTLGQDINQDVGRKQL